MKYLIMLAVLISGCGITIKPKDAKVKVEGNINHNLRLDPTFEAYFRQVCVDKLAPGATEEQIQSCIAEEVTKALRL